MVGSMLVRIIGVAALVAGLAGDAAEAFAREDLARRLDGQPAGALRAVWRQFGISSRLFADAHAAPLRALREGRPPHVILSVTGGGEGDRQYLVFARRPEGC